MIAGGAKWILHPSRADEITIWSISDMHLGNRGVAKDRLFQDIEAIRSDPNAFWLCTGDYGDYISQKDRKRFDPRVIDREIIDLPDLVNLGQVITEYVYELLKPIASKCLGIGYGNHEEYYGTTYEQSGLHGWLCKELGVSNLGYSAMFHLRFVRYPRIKAPRLITNLNELPKSAAGTRRSLTVLTHHGAGHATTKGGKVNRLEKFASISDADLIFVGHSHDPIPLAMPVLSLDQSGCTIRERKRLVMMAGSYLRTYARGAAGYGERHGYSTVPLGGVWASIKPETGEMRSEVRA